MRNDGNGDIGGPRKYLVDLGAELGFPNIPLVIPQGRLSWESAAKYLGDDQIIATITKIEAHVKETV